MKPSARIYQLIGQTRSDPEFHERCLFAIVEYLDEQWEKEQKGRHIMPVRYGANDRPEAVR